MDDAEIEQSLSQALEEDALRGNEFGEYHPSQVSGCPLKVFFDYMTEAETALNHWLLQGTAVHYWLQETGVLSKALHKAGYHELDTEYEVPTKTRIAPGVYITGTCDILAHDGDNTAIMDIKYSSVNPDTQPKRVFKYFTQVNTYSHMFGADEHALILVNNRSDNIPKDGIQVLSGEPSEDNWEKVKERAIGIHEALNSAGYQDGVRWNHSELEGEIKSFWKDVMEPFPKDSVPTYSKECQYCDHSDICPVEQGKLGGVGSFKGGR